MKTPDGTARFLPWDRRLVSRTAPGAPTRARLRITAQPNPLRTATGLSPPQTTSRRVHLPRSRTTATRARARRLPRSLRLTKRGTKRPHRTGTPRRRLPRSNKSPSRLRHTCWPYQPPKTAGTSLRGVTRRALSPSTRSPRLIPNTTSDDVAEAECPGEPKASPLSLSLATLLA